MSLWTNHWIFSLSKQNSSDYQSRSTTSTVIDLSANERNDLDPFWTAERLSFPRISGKWTHQRAIECGILYFTQLSFYDCVGRDILFYRSRAFFKKDFVCSIFHANYFGANRNIWKVSKCICREHSALSREEMRTVYYNVPCWRYKSSYSVIVHWKTSYFSRYDDIIVIVL